MTSYLNRDLQSHPDLGRPITISIAVVSALSIFKFLLCARAPEVLSGAKGLEIDIASAQVAGVLLATGCFFVFCYKNIRAALIFVMMGLYVLTTIGALRAQLIIFHIGREFNLIDNRLAMLDEYIGFDWVVYFKWVGSHPNLSWMITQAYQSIWVQPIALALFFICHKKVHDFAQLQIALPLSFALVCVTATFLPALGAYQFHGMTPDQHLSMSLAFADGMTAPMLWVRQAELPLAMPNFPDLRVITFPSWHAAAAVIFILSAWSHHSIRWISFILNTLMLAATPVQGSHYLSDMIFGGALGGTAFAFARWVLTPKPLAWVSALTQPAPTSSTSKA